MRPDYAANLWNEALNKRLGTQVLYLVVLHLADNSQVLLLKF